MHVIFNNLKVLFKASNNISTENVPEIGSKSKSEMSVTGKYAKYTIFKQFTIPLISISIYNIDFLIPSGNDSESSSENESNESSESVEGNDSEGGKQVNKRYSKLMHMFK